MVSYATPSCRHGLFPPLNHNQNQILPLLSCIFSSIWPQQRDKWLIPDAQVDWILRVPVGRPAPLLGVEGPLCPALPPSLCHLTPFSTLNVTLCQCWEPSATHVLQFCVYFKILPLICLVLWWTPVWFLQLHISHQEIHIQWLLPTSSNKRES